MIGEARGQLRLSASKRLWCMGWRGGRRVGRGSLDGRGEERWTDGKKIVVLGRFMDDVIEE